MLIIKTTSQFQKDYKKAVKADRNIKRLKQVMSWIAKEESLPPALRDHKLVGNYIGRRECHLAGDWLLIYKLEKKNVVFERTGSHSELLKK
jgi:mRNA interferase YafQ